MKFNCATGHGVPSSDSEALSWYQRAAEAGYAEAMVKVAECYLAGNGIAADRREAPFWLRKGYREGELLTANKLRPFFADIDEPVRSWTDSDGATLAHLEAEINYRGCLEALRNRFGFAPGASCEQPRPITKFIQQRPALTH